MTPEQLSGQQTPPLNAIETQPTGPATDETINSSPELLPRGFTDPLLALE